MKIVKVEQIQVELPFKSAFQTSYGLMTHKLAAIYVVHDEDGFYGLGELDALEYPDYIEETFDSALVRIEHQLLPLVLHRDIHHPSDVADLFRVVQGNFMAKSALETAIWDLYARRNRRPLRELIGGVETSIEVGVSIGIIEDFDQLVRDVRQYVNQGYRRVKLKIKPGYDFEPLRRIRDSFPELQLMADANSAYQDFEDWAIFDQLDTLGLAMIEQPFNQRDYIKHAALQEKMATRICLDESIRSLEDVQTAYALGSCRAINLKIPRVGGLTEAMKIWTYCQEKSLLVWIGGMYEAGIGRALNLQVSTVPIFTFPGDLSASTRYFNEDIVTPDLVLEQGYFPLPNGPGIGVDLDWEIVARYQKKKTIFK